MKDIIEFRGKSEDSGNQAASIGWFGIRMSFTGFLMDRNV